jgi:hypothetical protein
MDQGTGGKISVQVQRHDRSQTRQRVNSEHAITRTGIFTRRGRRSDLERGMILVVVVVMVVVVVVVVVVVAMVLDATKGSVELVRKFGMEERNNQIINVSGNQEGLTSARENHVMHINLSGALSFWSNTSTTSLAVAISFTSNLSVSVHCGELVSSLTSVLCS